MHQSAPSSTYSSQGRFLAHSEQSDDRHFFRVQFIQASSQEAQVLRWHDVLSLWQQDDEFRELFTIVLAKVPYPGFFWETPPITRTTIQKAFECAILDSPRLAHVSADPQPFLDYIGSNNSSSQVEVFPNLGKDALLVVPYPNGPLEQYAHIASFVRSASRRQIHAMWAAVGYAVEQALNRQGLQPLWVSTSGLGVYWLHVRIDSSPKYYCHAPYKTVPQ